VKFSAPAPANVSKIIVTFQPSFEFTACFVKLVNFSKAIPILNAESVSPKLSFHIA
jgi:hypothetical protein